MNIFLSNIKQFLIILGLIHFSFLPSHAQQNVFPEDWLGLWTGELIIYQGPVKVNTLPMTLSIEKAETEDTWSYTIQYGPDSTGVRPYSLVRLDSLQGRYILDENNGIKIETFQVGDRMISHFDVMNSNIITATIPQGDNMLYEIYAGRETPVFLSGDTIIQGDTIPEVKTYPFMTLQRALLKRQ